MAIRKREIRLGDGRTFRERIVTSDRRTLNDIMSSLRGANNSRFINIKGMFWRSHDFEGSASQLGRELTVTEDLTDRYKYKGYASQDFLEEAKSKGIIFNTHSERGFKTISLDVALRHFINDTCRILEPSTRLLEAKTGLPKSRSTLSLNGYIKELDASSISYGFDGAFFIAFYEELWNDYKHAESNGITVGGYSLNDNDEIIYPDVCGDRLVYFKGKTVDDFFDETLKHVKQFVDFIK